MIKKAFAVGSVLTLLSGFANAGVIRHDVPDSSYKNLSYQSQFDSVGAVLFDTNDGGFICSGTVVAKHWVLTAAHCVDEATSMNFYLPQYNADRSGILSHKEYTATSWVAHQNWTGDLIEGWDVGLMYVEEGFDVGPAELYRGSGEALAVGTHVGYGATGNGTTGETLGAGTRRAGQNVVDGLFSSQGSGEQLLWSDFDHPDPTATDLFGDLYNDWVNFLLADFGFSSENLALGLEYSIAGGDSGGAVFIQENDKWWLAGVHSLGANINGPDASYGNLYASTRVSDFSSWIDSYITEEVSVSSTFALFGVGFMLLGLRRRRQDA